VVRGAVIEKLDPVGESLVQLRLCRRHYGASLLEPFDEEKHKEHKEEDKFLEPNTGMVFGKGIFIFRVPGCAAPFKRLLSILLFFGC
jgi:hypothetical protein